MLKGSKTKMIEYMRAIKVNPNRYLYLQNTLKKLINEGMDINTQGYLGNTLLHLAVQLNNVKLLNMFLRYGVMGDLANDQGETPLHRAVLKGNLEMVRLLVKNGCDIDCARELEQTPLHLAVINGDIEMVKLLVSLGADILRMDEINNLPIDYAIDEKDKNLIEYFLSQQTVNEDRTIAISKILMK